MQWELLGFKDDPFKTHPITAYSLDLYTGNKSKVDTAKFALNTDNLVMVVEGKRGVGTTSFGNFVRFTVFNEKKYFTPNGEIKVEPYWNADTLMAAVLGSIVTSLDLKHAGKVKNDQNFKEAKAVVGRITETYSSFGLSGFGVGASYGVSGAASQPMIMPTPILAHHLEGLAKTVKKLGYKHGLLLQLNNLDVGTVQDEEHLTMLFNVMRDYFQMPNTSWILVGDTQLRQFIAQKVDRLDDIVTCEIDITPLSDKEYMQLIDKRIGYFRVNDKVKLPVDKDVWKYLFAITKGRLRYIFGLMSRLYGTFKLGELTEHISLEMAKPAIKEFGEQRLKRHNLSATDLTVLKKLVSLGRPIQVKELSEEVGKAQTQVSRILNNLYESRLVEYRQEWRSRYYNANIDAQLAYSES